MSPHIEPPEELVSLLNQLNAGVSVSPRHLRIQPLYPTIKPDFSGCGTYEGFYRDCFSKASGAISYSWKRIAEMNGGRIPYKLKLNYSVGRLPSSPRKYNPAWITPISPVEYNIMFNERNEELLGEYAREGCTSIMNHETGVHVPAHSTGLDLSEPETERINVESLHEAGLHKEANLTKRGSKYLSYIV